MKLNIQSINKRETTREIVYKELKTAILDGEIEKDEVFTETQLSNLFNTSRTPIREAISDLLNDGLIISIPRKGLQVRKIDEDEKEQIFFLRLFIEQEGIKKLSSIITKDQVNYLQKIVEKQKQAMVENNKIEFIDMDQEFHIGILQFANQHLFKQILQDLYNLTRLIGLKALVKKGRMEEVVSEHNEILIAMEEDNPSMACELIIEHLNITKQSLNIVENE
ncbi:GntR family transcriptional regulator [Virgibacillus ihumii]|uniref:GntR family transcriptional regulator n=1 Tax=Virgibacillus ihumii TaxID=2686091 RepID=UPI00157E1ACC|nr:GntR family transcriptional regulator [Virgibacillus ihumii]